MTYREFAEKYLEGEVQKQYIANVQNLNLGTPNYIDHNLSTAIPDSIFFTTAFCWAGSPEGYDYWAKISKDFEHSLSKEKTYTVYFLTPYCTWENVKAHNMKKAIKKCNIPLDYDGYSKFVAIEQPD